MEDMILLTKENKAGKVSEGECFCSCGETQIRGKEISYHIDAQEFLFLDEQGEAEASVFLTSQFLNCEKPEKRPVLFVVNGGPGMSSGDLFVTMYGPYSVECGEDHVCPSVAPYKMKKNENWLLDVCDIVLIDPVGCGYGRLIKQEAAHKFFGIEQDGYALAKIIAFWLNKYERHNSAKYLSGVSYGGIRCASIPSYLLGGVADPSKETLGITLNGIIPMSDCNMYDFTDEAHGMDLADYSVPVAILPTCAATAHYHFPEGKPSAEEFINEADVWGETVLNPFLKNLENATENEKKEIAEKLAYYTGLKSEVILEMNFQYDAFTYINLLFGEQNQAVGFYDSRQKMEGGAITSTTFDVVMDDAFINRAWPAVKATACTLYRKKLGVHFKDEREYVVQNYIINECWDFRTRNKIRMHELMVGNMRHNPELRMLLVVGKYDFCYPIKYARFMSKNIGLPKDRVELLESEAGHFPYFSGEGQRILAERMRLFIH